MKKFVFTNEKYYGIKLNDYDALKRDMENVDKSIEMVLRDIAANEQRFEDERKNQIEECKKGVSAGQLRTFAWYFPYLREQLEKLGEKLLLLEEEKRKLTQRLIKLHNEIKVLEQMKEDQYAEYLKEVALEEAKEMDSFMSFTIYEGAG